ncbi:hypothetical protein LCGC14_2716640 [marine sediment metagenome]|uniref:Uncharacterized protein n=1 Tax=marine sediment metagenome TaxID=412755 RepID=A0A0F9C333_9ZZZZ
MKVLLTLKITTEIEANDQLQYEQLRDSLINSLESLDTAVDVESEDKRP